jgi:hypothetical protein
MFGRKRRESPSAKARVIGSSENANQSSPLFRGGTWRHERSRCPVCGIAMTQKFAHTAGVSAKRWPNDKSRPIFRGGLKKSSEVLAHDSIGPLPCLVFRRFDLEAELLCHVPANKPANAVILPAGCLNNLRREVGSPAVWLPSAA